MSVGLDFAKALEHLYSKFKLDESERAVLGAADTTSTLITVLGKLSSPTERHEALKAHLDAVGAVTPHIAKLVRAMMPKFMYFAAYDRMDGAIQIDQTRQLIANGQIDQDAHRGARLFAEFLQYAGVSIDDITNVATYETFNARLQAASNNITDQVLEYWTQNPDLNVVVRVEQARPGDPAPLNAGTVAWARINNALHRVDTPFSERSAGFVWFFSFLVKFAQVRDEETPVVLLLDEPGLTLHGNGRRIKATGGRVAKVAIGMDVRLDEFGNVHPWRVVVAFDGKYRQYFMRLPPNRRYVSPPEDEHGDLTMLPCSAEERTEEVADFLCARGETAVICAEWHWNAPVIVGLRARGIEVEEIKLPIPGDMMTDVHRIGGEAGHEISQLLDPEVREVAFAWQALERGEVSVQ